MACSPTRARPRRPARGPRPAHPLLGPGLVPRPPARPRGGLGRGGRRGQLRPAPGEVLGLVGESGSGKTTLGRTLLGLVDATGGQRSSFEGEEITGLSERELRPLRRRMQIVFQDPHASLNPAMTIGAAVGDPLRFHGIAADREDRRDGVAAALERVGLAPAAQFVDKYPADLSGGQKQRAVLARAIILGPDVLVADEPVSMLDMSVRAKILELMIELKYELDLTYIYITHDLATAKFFCDRIAIMYLGRIVELGPAEQIYADPKHPYTAVAAAGDPRARPEPQRAPRPAARRGPRRGRAAARLLASTRAARRRSRSAAGRAATCARCSRRAGPSCPRPSTRRERRADRRPRRARRAGARRRPARRRRPRARRGGGDGVLEAMRAAAPDDPLWKGVAETEALDDAVEVSFNHGAEPRAPRGRRGRGRVPPARPGGARRRRAGPGRGPGH